MIALTGKLHPMMVLLLFVASLLIGTAASDGDASEKCTCSPCGSPCTYPNSPPPVPEYYPPPPPVPEYYPPPPPVPEYYPPPPPTPEYYPPPPTPVLPPTPSTPICPPPPPPPSPPSSTTPANPCCSPSSAGTPYFGLTPPGQLYPQDPAFRSSVDRRSSEGRLVVFVVFALISLWC